VRITEEDFFFDLNQNNTFSAERLNYQDTANDVLKSEQTLQSRNDELAKVNHQMEKFLYSASHDLRSPLTTILGLVNLIRMENCNPTILDYIFKVEESTHKLDRIIRDIMSFSRATSQRAKCEKICLEDLVWKSINDYRTEPIFQNIHFDVKATGTYPFFSDQARIEIILDNIVRNCFHFYDVNKSISFIKVNIGIETEQAQVEFIDNGIGIGQQHLDHIFNMFYKASHLARGAGLELFIVKETLEKLHGTIHFESEIGFGTVIRICIPNDYKAG
jgi:signal transduction histidine kinase